jgi:hypothetical protein
VAGRTRTAAPPRPVRGPLLGVLAAGARRPYTTTMLARELGGRSRGAVGAALDRLVAAGLVTVSGSHPRWYQITPAGVAEHSRTPTAAAAAPGRGGRPAQPRTPTPSAPAAAAGAGAVRRPAGQLYHPRRLAGSTDLEVLRRLRGEGLPVLLYGPPGTGKTALVEAAFPDVITVAAHGDTATEDLLGSYVPTPGGGFEFTDGPLATAMRTGRVLFLDDATLIAPKVLAVLYPAMDGRATITVAANRHDAVTAAAGFYTIAGHNPGVHGAVLTDALASRFGVHIEVSTDFELARSLGVPAPAVAAAQTLNARLRAGDTGWAPQLRELLAFTHLAATLGTHSAIANLLALAPEPDRDTVTAALARAFGTTGEAITPLGLGRQHRPAPPT